jgi:hypothetical protein
MRRRRTSVSSSRIKIALLSCDLESHSRVGGNPLKTPVAKISKMMKRTVGALRQQALKLGMPLGHRRSALGLPAAANLPAVKWRQIHLDKLPAEKRAAQVAALEKVLSG